MDAHNQPLLRGPSVALTPTKSAANNSAGTDVKIDESKAFYQPLPSHDAKSVADSIKFIQQQHSWVRELDKKAASFDKKEKYQFLLPPEKAKGWRRAFTFDNGVSLFALISLVTSSVIYYDGTTGMYYMYIGGHKIPLQNAESVDRAMSIIINGVPTILYSQETVKFFRDWRHNIKEHPVRFVTALVLAVLATGVVSISDYNLSTENNGASPFTSFLHALSVGIGTLSISIWGMASVLEDLINALNDIKGKDAAIRNQLILELEQCVRHDPRLYNSIKGIPSLFTKIIGGIVGMILGGGNAVSQWGYLCSSIKTLGYPLGIGANTPPLSIAILVTGLKVGRALAVMGEDTYKAITGKKGLPFRYFTNREKLFLALYAANWSAGLASSLFSNPTSITLYEQDCPTYSPVVDALLQFIVENNTVLFNWLMANFTAWKFGEWWKIAYATASEEIAKFRFYNLENYLQNAPIAEIIKLRDFREFEIDHRKRMDALIADYADPFPLDAKKQKSHLEKFEIILEKNDIYPFKLNRPSTLEDLGMFRKIDANKVVMIKRRLPSVVDTWNQPKKPADKPKTVTAALTIANDVKKPTAKTVTVAAITIANDVKEVPKPRLGRRFSCSN